MGWIVIPAWRLVVNGVDATSRVGSRLVEIEVTDDVAGASGVCRIVVEAGDVETPPTGAVLDLEMGYEHGLAPMGRYTVAEVEPHGPPAVLEIVAPAAAMGSLKTRRTRAWSGVTMGAVAEDVARRHGLRLRIDPAVAGVVLPHADQAESDLQFVTRLARGLDCACTVAGGRLVVRPRQELAGGAAVEVRTPAEFATATTERPAAGRVVARWWDLDAARMRVEVAGDGDPALVLPAVAVDRATARNAAESRWRGAQRAARSGRVRLAAGDPAVAADVPIRLVGVREDVDGVWMPRRVVHTLSPGRGYQTEADIEAVTTQWERASSSLPPDVAAPVGIDVGAGGGGSPPPPVEPPDRSDIVEVIGLQYPGELAGVGEHRAFVQRVVGALHALDARWGGCWRALPTSDEIAYYRGADLRRADGSPDVTAIQIAAHESGRWVTVWRAPASIDPPPLWYRP